MSWAIEEKTYSQTRACALIGLAPKTFCYQAKREGDEAIRRRLRELAGERRRFGYRRLHLLLCREGKRPASASLANSTILHSFAAILASSSATTARS